MKALYTTKGYNPQRSSQYLFAKEYTNIPGAKTISDIIRNGAT
jgi:hypothetical protein